jgi:hypothetical protein
MADNQSKRHAEEESSLRGTFFSVMLLGSFLVLTWIGVFTLFIYRG